MNTNWYALRSKPNKEDYLWRQASALGFDVFYPRITTQPVNPRARKVRPYFPGYLFVRVEPREAGQSALMWMPYSQGLVGFDGQPASIPEGLIQAIRRRTEAACQAGRDFLGGLEAGEEINIQAGPFSGYEAIFDMRLPGTERVRVLLNLLSKQQIPLELPAGYIERKKRI